MSDFAAQIEALRLRLAEATDLATRNVIVSELGRLNRKRVLTQSVPLLNIEWMPIPVITYQRSRDTLDEGGLKDLIKTFFRMLAAGIESDESLSTPDDFVTLFRVEEDDECVQLTLVCPYAHPLRFIRGMISATIADRVSRNIWQRILDLDIEYRFKLLNGSTIPLAFSWDRVANRLIIINHNHFANPDQFIVPALCTTTSGFLNFIGSLQIKFILQDRKEIHVEGLESLINRGFDDWFRWFYTLVETGEIFNPAHMYVQRTNPEIYTYLYGR